MISVSGLIFLISWLCKAGMSLTMALMIVLPLFIVYVGVARIIAESGVVHVGGPMTPQTFSLYLLGADTVGPSGLTSMIFSYALVSWGGGLFTPALAHIARLGDFIRGNRRTILIAIVVGFMVASATTLGYTLYISYHEGANNFGHGFICAGAHLYPDTMSKIKDPFHTDWDRFTFFWIGIGVMSFLTFMRYRFPWWPLHPFGFAICGTDGVRIWTLSIFLAWAYKFIVLKFGGMAFYRKCRPFFLGLLLGYVVAVVVSFIVDMIWFPGAGHMIHPLTYRWGY